MKTLNVFGWAVIFTVTLLLAACAALTPEVADTDKMSGPDLTMTQTESQQQMMDRRESALVIREAWLDERELQLSQRERDLERHENALAINQAWLNERETRLAQGVPDLTKQADLAAFEQSWLNKGEPRFAQVTRDLTRQEEIYTFNQKAWRDDQEMRLAQSKGVLDTSSIKLAGTDYTPVVASFAPIRVESGRCYANVVYPAEYKTVAVIKPIEVPKGEKLPVLYQTVTEKVKVTDEQTRWEEVLCEDRMTECRVMEIQRALSRGGYNPGPIDGVVGRQTLAAVKNFQKDFNLTVADQLTIETVNTLDANF
jgi:hypothetical protein